MVVGWRETTELSSLIASSTTSRFGDFFLSRIAVLKSFLVFLKQIPQEDKQNQLSDEIKLKNPILNIEKPK
jgi:hypothetical protein